MTKPYIEFSIYKVMGKEYPRMCIDQIDNVTDNGSGTRIYGGKFGSFPSIKTFKIPLTDKLIDEIIKELLNCKVGVSND